MTNPKLIALMITAALSGSSTSVAVAAPALPATALTAETVNDAAQTTAVTAGSRGAAVLRAQILLDRWRFSPGEIDGAYGSNMRRAIAGSC